MAKSPPSGPTPAPKPLKFPKPPLGKSIPGPFQDKVQNVGDVFESDIVRIQKKRTEPGYETPAVGDKHPDSDTYPNHVLITPPIPAQDGETVELLYARVRTNLGKKIIEEYGGGVVDIKRDVTLTGDEPAPDEGLLVTESSVEDDGAGRFLKQTAQLSEEIDASLTLNSGGSAYTSAPTVGFTGGTGSGAVATAEIGKAIASIAINNAGNYNYPPVVYAVGDGYGFVGVANINGAGHITSVTIIDGGVWASAPAIHFVGGNGSGGVATATLATTGAVTKVTLTTPGSYTVAPTVTFSGGGGTGAAATYNIPDIEWPELTGDDTDSTYGIVVDLSRKVVPAGTKYPGVAVSLISPYVDIQPHDRWRSIQIVSKVDLRTLPVPITWGATHELDLPATLLGVTANWDKTGGGTSTSDVNRLGIATATVEVSDGVLGSIEVLFRHNYRGPARAEVTRQFFFGPPTLASIAAITKIIPVTGTASLIGKHVKFTQSRGTSFTPVMTNETDGNDGQLRTESKTFGPFLSGGIVNGVYSFVGSGNSAIASAGPDTNGNTFTAELVLPGVTGKLTINIPVSTPTDIQSGDWITVSSEPENWRFGIFVVHTIRVLVP